MDHHRNGTEDLSVAPGAIAPGAPVFRAEWQRGVVRH